MVDYTAAQIDYTSKTSLTLGDVAKLQTYLDAGDRANVYIQLYAWTGNEQYRDQLQITTYSGFYGGAALVGNAYAKLEEPEIYNNQSASLDAFTVDIVQGQIDALENDIGAGNVGILTADQIQNADYNVWEDKGLGQQFPGNILFIDFLVQDDMSIWDALNIFVSEGSVDAINAANLMLFAGGIGTRVEDFALGDGFSVEQDSELGLQYIVNDSTGLRVHVTVVEAAAWNEGLGAYTTTDAEAFQGSGLDWMDQVTLALGGNASFRDDVRRYLGADGTEVDNTLEDSVDFDLNVRRAFLYGMYDVLLWYGELHIEFAQEVAELTGRWVDHILQSYDWPIVDPFEQGEVDPLSQFMVRSHAQYDTPLEPYTMTYDHPDLPGVFIDQLHVISENPNAPGEYIVEIFELYRDANGNYISDDVVQSMLPENTDYSAELAFYSVVQYLSAEGEQTAPAEQVEQGKRCFGAGTPISMWDGSERLIEDVVDGDEVLSYTKWGELVSGRVTQTFRNDVTFVLDLFGLTVTPGHATLCGDGTFTGQHVPIIDILRTDGALVHEDGHLVRAATGCDVGSSGDQFIWAMAGPKLADGSINVVQSGRIRLGTRLITSEGRDVSVQELVENAGGRVTPDGLLTTGVLQSPQSGMPFHWAFGDALPKAEDYVLQRSGFELKDLYEDLEGQTMGSLLPLPSVGGSTPETSANQLGLMLNRSVGKERLQ